jgi:hypothetical protein
MRSLGMETVVDPRLLEESVFLALRSTAFREHAESTRHRLLVDELYEIADSDRRDAAFQNLNQNTFIRLGLDKNIDSAINFFPALKMRLARLVFVYSERRKDEEAELFHHAVNGWSLIFRVRAETMIEGAAFRRLALHEMAHASNMLDPEFGYIRSLDDIRRNAQHRDIIRDRFRCLWDICIDSSLCRQNEQPLQHREFHELSFFRNFGVSELTRSIFSRLWNGEMPSRPTGRNLLEAAQVPESLCSLVGFEPHASQTAGIRDFNKTCPLCQGPTTQWVRDPSKLSSEVIQSIQRKFPDWSPSEPICCQCEEVFRANLSTAL